MYEVNMFQIPNTCDSLLLTSYLLGLFIRLHLIQGLFEENLSWNTKLSLFPHRPIHIYLSIWLLFVGVFCCCCLILFFDAAIVINMLLHAMFLELKNRG